MDIRLTPEDLELQRRARTFTEQVLFPLELECEEHDGLSPESFGSAKRAVLDAGFNAINHREENGGQGFDGFQQILIEEEWGKATGALWDIPWRPAIPLAAIQCTREFSFQFIHTIACSNPARTITINFWRAVRPWR